MVSGALVGLFAECQGWATDISDSALVFSNSNTTAKRPNSASCFPAAFAKLPGPRAFIEICLNAAPFGSNWLSFGLTKRGMDRESSDGLGRTTDTWGIADERSYAAGNEMPQVLANTDRKARLPRKFKAGDVLLGFVDVTAGWFEVRLNQTEFVHRFTIPPGAKEDYWFGVTLADNHQVTVVTTGPPPPLPTPAPTPMPQRSKLNAHCPVNPLPHCRLLYTSHLVGMFTESQAWSTDISNNALTFSNSNSTALRAGGVSCYPAAFARLPASLASMEVRLNAAPIGANWLSFGLTQRGMEPQGTEGLGHKTNSWGVADDRAAGKEGVLPVVMANRIEVGRLPRKLKRGDVLLGFANVIAGWFEVRLNQTEFVQRFTIPPGTKEDYWFGMTFASDHQAMIVSAAPAPVAPVPTPVPVPAPMPQRRKCSLFHFCVICRYISYFPGVLHNRSVHGSECVGCEPLQPCTALQQQCRHRQAPQQRLFVPCSLREASRVARRTGGVPKHRSAQRKLAVFRANQEGLGK
jgi:hypothetical protein